MTGAVFLAEEADKMIPVDWRTPSIQVLAGSLLGDGTLTFSERSKTPAYREMHCLRQRAYLEWKQRIIGGSMALGKYFDRRTQRWYSRVHLWMTDPRNIALYSVFYPMKRKEITRTLLDNLDTLGMLVWWLDDGSVKLHDNNGKLSTQGFSAEQNGVAMDWFSEKHGICAHISSENEIFFSSKELPKLLALIYPLFKKYDLPSCMRYKMGSSDKRNSNLILLAKEKRRQHDRKRYHIMMSDPIYRATVRLKARLRQKRRLSDPLYQMGYNEYHKIWQRNYRRQSIGQ